MKKVDIKVIWLGNLRLDEVNELNLPDEIEIGLVFPDGVSDTLYIVKHIENKQVFAIPC